MSDNTDDPSIPDILARVDRGDSLYRYQERALAQRVRELEGKLHAAESIMDDNETPAISVDCPICGRREIEERAVATRKQVSCRACGTEWMSRKSLYEEDTNE